MKVGLTEFIVIGTIIGFTKLYGDYRYWCGRCDSDDIHKIVTNAQSQLIEELKTKLEKEES